MAEKYFVRREGKLIGPLSLSKLQEAIRVKKLKPSDEVGTDPSSDFQLLRDAYRQILAGEWPGKGQDNWLDALSSAVAEEKTASVVAKDISDYKYVPVVIPTRLRDHSGWKYSVVGSFVSSLYYISSGQGALLILWATLLLSIAPFVVALLGAFVLYYLSFFWLYARFNPEKYFETLMTWCGTIVVSCSSPSCMLFYFAEKATNDGVSVKHEHPYLENDYCVNAISTMFLINFVWIYVPYCMGVGVLIFMGKMPTLYEVFHPDLDWFMIAENRQTMAYVAVSAFVCIVLSHVFSPMAYIAAGQVSTLGATNPVNLTQFVLCAPAAYAVLYAILLALDVVLLLTFSSVIVIGLFVVGYVLDKFSVDANMFINCAVVMFFYVCASFIVILKSSIQGWMSGIFTSRHYDKIRSVAAQVES